MRQPPGPQPVANADALFAAQSVNGAALAALATTAVLNAAWVWMAAMSGKFFPWFSVIQGWLIGIAVQRRGRGLDWRFPAMAAAIAVLGSFSGGFFVALATTVTELEAGPLRILRGLTWNTWKIYFAEVVNPLDFVYAVAAAGLAAFYAGRRLLRHEVLALRRTAGKTFDE